MSPRAQRLAVILLIVVALLFAGRWAAVLVTERWWAAQLSPAASAFVTRWTLMSSGLEAAGVAVACLWFVLHLLLVYKAIGAVRVRSRLGNLEISEAVNLRAIGAVGIACGLVLGFVAGRGAGGWTPTLLVGWSGLHYGESDPLMARDIGFYLTRLPVWRQLHGYIVLLTLLALFGVTTLYILIRAITWADRRLTVKAPARVHLGGLAVLLALALAWGYLLEPYELIGGIIGTVHSGLFTFRAGAALALAGMACGAALVSLWWSIRGNHRLLAAVWAVLAAASLLGHHIIPAFLGPDPDAALESGVRRHLDQLAYGMTALRDTTLATESAPLDPLRPVAVWHATLAAEATGADSGRLVAADRAVVTLAQHQRPAWILVRDRAEAGAVVSVLLDDQTSPLGHPILVHDSDSLRTPGGAPSLLLPPRGLWPRGPSSVVDSAEPGVLVGQGLRRLTLAWALQSASLLGRGPAGERVFWHLDPVDRLGRLAPFAVWGTPVPRLIGGDLVWLVDGYLASDAFPGSSRVRWRGRWIGSLVAAFVAVVNAESGATDLYLRHGAGEVAKEWQALTDSLIRPSSALPPEVVRALPYPAELLEVQLRVLGQPHWELGEPIGRVEAVGVSGPAAEGVWETDTSGVAIVVPFASAGAREVAGIVQAHVADGWEHLALFRLDTLVSLPDPTSLGTRWGKFPTFQQLRDSVEKEGSRLEAGPVRYWPTAVGLGAYQPWFAHREGTEPLLKWVSIAVPDRRGAGHDFDEAWQNLLGLSAPIISAGARGSQLLEARRHLDAAEAALTRGDLEGFARAWEALKRTLRSP